MNKPVFDRSDFQLCDVPVPKGYPQSQTHAGVAFNGVKFYLTTSPYPGPDYGVWEWRIMRMVRIMSFGKLCKIPNGEHFENPCIYVGEKDVVGAPVQFELMQRTALMETPEEFNGLPSYNSDPDIYIEGDIIYVMNRSVIRTKIYEDHRPYDFDTRIYLMKGKDENKRFKLLSCNLVREGQDPYVSPSLVKLQGKYIVGYLDNRMEGSGVVFNNLYLSSANVIEEAIRSKYRYPIEVTSGNMIPWHISLFVQDETLYAIVTCVKKGDVSLKMWQMLGVFDKELKKINIFPRPLTDLNSYRGSAIVDNEGMFVLYTPTVHEKIVGSKSIDGRDILVATKKFEDILSQVKYE